MAGTPFVMASQMPSILSSEGNMRLPPVSGPSPTVSGIAGRWWLPNLPIFLPTIPT